MALISPLSLIDNTTKIDEEIAAMLPKAEPNMERLMDILSLKRCHMSIGEGKLIDQILAKYKPIPLMNFDDQTIAAFVVKVSDASVLWSCHIDTVHALGEDSKQLILFDEGTSMIYKQDNKPLGADDGAGVWLLLEMIDANVPGTYIFHRGEEKGGIGSRAVAKHHTAFLAGFTHAIAFDRRDSCSVITKQHRGRCCSEDFAQNMADKLSDTEYTLKPDPTGSFTDTANYINHIGECTNVSIGYHNEHRGEELLDVKYLLWLRDKMTTLPPSTFTCVNVRKAGEKDPTENYFHGGRFAKGYADSRWYNDAMGDAEEFMGYGFGKAVAASPAPKKKVKKIAAVSTPVVPTYPNYPSRAVAKIVRPRTAEDVLNMRGYEVKDWVQSAQVWEVVTLLTDLAWAAEFPNGKSVTTKK